ncbi:Acetyltransferase (GNAT) domain-containing protein [Kushneria avicenniae]|uniref:Acetyltransferase (GNAT) domain-containing protein n=2 Tax=Kushneria avicenniae TaxID=402385 RepID=A0A1I1KKQ3_9GAMM|nr:Acetyltransferase (GNAT) domain-containing protein [Kushneria avicenniae]
MRDYCPEDFDALNALYQRSKGDEFRFEKGWPDRFPIIPLSQDSDRLDMFNDSTALVVDVDTTGLAGVIYWQHSHIVGLMVRPEFRGRGIGRALMTAAFARMAGTVTLDVVASNVAAIRLYESLGFQRVDQREGRYQGVPVTMSMMRRGPRERVQGLSPV